MKRCLAIRLMLIMVACGAGVAACSPESTVDPVVPTAQQQSDSELPTVSATETIELPRPTVAVTIFRPTDTPEMTSVPEPTTAEEIEEVERLYQVVFVEEDDVLNVRSGPGVGNELAGSLEPQTTEIKLTGPVDFVDGSLWVSIQHEDVSGWVNSKFLTEDLDADSFCDKSEPEALVESFIEAISLQDSTALAEIADPERGLRIRRHWWNPEVIFTGSELEQLFDLEEIFEWGRADGSGNPIEGEFSEVIWPLLEMNLLAGEEVACNEILAGGTAGFVRLPFSYEGINYYSVYRPAGPDDIELDWGSWVIGIERFEEDYFVSFLVHFEWEI